MIIHRETHMWSHLKSALYMRMSPMMSVGHQHLSGNELWLHIWEWWQGQDEKLFLSTDRLKRWVLTCGLSIYLQTHSRYLDSSSQRAGGAFQWHLISKCLQLLVSQWAISKKNEAVKVSAPLLVKWKKCRNTAVPAAALPSVTPNSPPPVPPLSH